MRARALLPHAVLLVRRRERAQPVGLGAQQCPTTALHSLVISNGVSVHANVVAEKMLSCSAPLPGVACIGLICGCIGGVLVTAPANSPFAIGLISACGAHLAPQPRCTRKAGEEVSKSVL